MTNDRDVSTQRDLVANVLRENGVLGTIKAQLRSNVYLALDDGKELRVSPNLILFTHTLVPCTNYHRQIAVRPKKLAGFALGYWQA